MLTKYAYLVMVTPTNNNKYYEMSLKDGVIDVTYGRVESTKNKASYPAGRWNSLYNSKLKKGYQDMTALRAATILEESSQSRLFSHLSDVNAFFNILVGYASENARTKYLVASRVTQQQLDRAQEILDDLGTFLKKDTGQSRIAWGSDLVRMVNETLGELYAVIPRYMRHTSDHFLQGPDTGHLARIVEEEQNNVDSLASTAVVDRDQMAGEQPDIEESQLLLEAQGLLAEPATGGQVDQIRKLLGDSSDRFRSALAVVNDRTESRFAEDLSSKAWGKETRLLWHGSRNQNWWSILKSGLMIRPTNVVHTGSMFGDGVYFATRARKSIGYTSLEGSFWARGSDRRGYLALYEVTTGVQKDVHEHTSACYRFDNDRIRGHGYDCVFAHAGRSLMNDEVIIYNPDQCTIRYIVELN